MYDLFRRTLVKGLQVIQMSGTQYVRKLATAAAVSLALASGGAFGLGLGDIEMRSALNQPMEAEIRLTSVQPGELNGMIVQLASAEAFARAGIDRASVLSELSFTVDQAGTVPVIRISSRVPVVEPFLNFLLEVDWPQGRMIREYTVLLDPPVFMTPSATNRNSSSDQPALVQRGEEALVVPTPIQRETDSASEAVDLSLLAPPDVTGGEGELISLEAVGDGQQFDEFNGEIVSLTDLGAPNTAAIQQRDSFGTGAVESFDGFEVEVFGGSEETGNGSFAGSNDSTVVSLSDLGTSSGTANGSIAVERGDTLYEIAESNTVGGASIQQMMLALLKANDSAFINGNINLVKAGESLRVPTASEATEISQSQALAVINDQNQLWRDYRDSLRGTTGTQLASDTPSSFGLSSESSQEADAGVATVEPFIDEDASLLSSSAREIIENARNEFENREELKLIADNAPSSTASSATSNENSDAEAGRLGDVNRKLQLAREELSSTRLQSGDLQDQVTELESTSENLDALVTLRQTGVAQLEAQLADARNSGDEGSDVIQGVLDGASDTMSDASDAAGEFVDSGTNALTDAGEQLDEVELYSEDGDETAASGLDDEQATSNDEQVQPVQGEQAEEQTAWYQDVMAQPQKLAIAGLGLLAALGVAGTLLWRRRREDDVEEELGFGEGVDFIDDDEAADLQADISNNGFDDVDEFDDFGEVGGGVAAVGAGAAVAGVAAASSSFDDFDAEVGAQNFDDNQDFGGMEESDLSEMEGGSDSEANIDEALDRDDTISEVDVYLAYGLHGQAEELLHKAIERNPNQQEYSQKLLQTYHAQGNGDSYIDAARNFHARFGGPLNPEWAGVAAMGAELVPDESLFQLDGNSVESLGSNFSSDAGQLTEDDFLPALDSVDEMGAVNRSIDATNTDELAADLDDSEGGFSLGGSAAAIAGGAGAAAAAGAAALSSSKDSLVSSAKDSLNFDVDETELMDQSLDPAFAFDEADLEATGDFSQIAGELAEEEGDGIDFTSFDDTLAVGASSNLLDDTIADEDGLGAALTMDELDGVMGTADDLTLDLDQLSGDLELDSAELMNSDLGDLDLPELDAVDDLSANDLSARSASNDEDAMETMLDLAKAYIDMGDKDSASSALDEIVKSGNPAQVTEAETLLHKIS